MNTLQGAKLQQKIALEVELEKLMEMEELYWQQRGGDRWILQGDSNTGYFHLAANGRKRKKTIFSLEEDGVSTTYQELIQKMIYDYYKQLFGNRQCLG